MAQIVQRYSFCRVADDLVDNAKSTSEAKGWVKLLKKYLDLAYTSETTSNPSSLTKFIQSNFPTSAHASLLLLPTPCLSPQPLYDLLQGFEMDLEFSSDSNPFPIHDEQHLRIYGSRVAGTVAESCIELAYVHTAAVISNSVRDRTLTAGRIMGIALQYVNIARDIGVDAASRRVYLPTTWLKAEGLGPEDIVKDPTGPQVEKLRQKLLDQAMSLYAEARGAIEELPAEARGPMRVAVESYMEIGRVLQRPGYKVKAGRATVPKWRRLQVAWNALRG